MRRRLPLIAWLLSLPVLALGGVAYCAANYQSFGLLAQIDVLAVVVGGGIGGPVVWWALVSLKRAISQSPAERQEFEDSVLMALYKRGAHAVPVPVLMLWRGLDLRHNLFSVNNALSSLEERGWLRTSATFPGGAAQLTAEGSDLCALAEEVGGIQAALEQLEGVSIVAGDSHFYYGQINIQSQVQNVNSKIVGIDQRCQPELADAFRRLLGTLEGERDLTDQARAEIVTAIDELSEMAQQSPEQRRRFTVEAVLDRFARMVEGLGALARVWMEVSPVISQHLLGMSHR